MFPVSIQFNSILALEKIKGVNWVECITNKVHISKSFNGRVFHQFTFLLFNIK
ncbi:hypothetical protein Hanom_Chr17g01539681 [Helianthus anomalus]